MNIEENYKSTNPINDPIKKAIDNHNKTLTPNIEELMEKLPLDSVLCKVECSYYTNTNARKVIRWVYYPTRMDYDNIINDTAQKSNESLRQFIQRIVENE